MTDPSVPPAMAEAADSMDDLVRLRRHIHKHPELGFHENATARLVTDELRKLGLSARTGVAGTGVIADVVGSHPGPTVLLRADMDALPIEEQSDTGYASLNRGNMHACGHDGHVAMLLVAARLLVERSESFAGRIRFLFQPAEERPPGGALAMIAEGALDGVDAALAIHLWNPLPVGTVGVTPGIVMAAHDRLSIHIAGHGGHGGVPESARDPVVALAALVGSLQTVVSRTVSPLDSAVVTVGRLNAGTAFNVIPDATELDGSIRSLGDSVRNAVHERIRAIAAGVATAYGVRASVDIAPFVPAVVNNEQLTRHVAGAVDSLVGDNAVRRDFRVMASDDMAFIQERVPGCYVFVGSGYTDGRETFPHHHPSFDIDESALPIGAAMLVRATMAVLSN